MDRAFDLDPVIAMAMAVAFGRFEGQEFDWDAMAFRERR